MEESMELYGISVVRLSANRWKAENRIDYRIGTSPSKAVALLTAAMIAQGVEPVVSVAEGGVVSCARK